MHSGGIDADELYGPNRNKHAINIRNRLLKSSVLQNGEYNYTQDKLKKDIWTTSSNVDFAGGLRVKPASPCGIPGTNNGKQHLESHFELGNDSGTRVPNKTYQISATQEDFDVKLATRPHVHKEDKTVNWPDMAPQYSSDRNVGSTEYRGAYLTKALAPVTPSFPRINTCKVSLPVDSQTHRKNCVSINLGSDHNSLMTETSGAYGRVADPDGGTLAADLEIKQRLEDARVVTDRMRDMSINSNVFRKGDYNDHGKDRNSSVFALDYCKKSTTALTNPLSILKQPTESGTGKQDEDEEEEDEDGNLVVKRDMHSQLFSKTPSTIQHHLNTFVPNKFKAAEEGRIDHISAHFQLGTDGNNALSMYSKDFPVAEKLSHQGAYIQPAPKDSAVIQRDSDRPTGYSTNRTEFCPKTYEMGVNANADLRKTAVENMFRRHGNGVILAYDKDSNKEDRQASLSMSTYVQPPSDFRAMPPTKATVGKYNYLETEVALPHPVPKNKKTETQYNYRGCMMDAHSSTERRRENTEQTRGRLDHGRGTHFVFGYDNLDYMSEHNNNFEGRTAQDEHIAPAGKKEVVPDKDFNHLSHSVNAHDLSAPNPYAASIGESLRARHLAVSRTVPVLPDHVATVMKNDFQPLAQRQYTAAQLVVLDQNNKLSSKPIADSHLFHTDQPGKKNFRSTTMADFMRPEKVAFHLSDLGKLFWRSRPAPINNIIINNSPPLCAVF